MRGRELSNGHTVSIWDGKKKTLRMNGSDGYAIRGVFLGPLKCT